MSFEIFPPDARVWIYQADRLFTELEVSQLKEKLAQFTEQWVSHNRQLRAAGDVLHDRFVVLMVDESQAGASGCSIDKSVYFLQHLEQAFGVRLFDRLNFAWLENSEVKTAPSEAFPDLYTAGAIGPETLVFDNLVKTKGELEEKWLKPLNQSWHKRYLRR